MVMGFDKIKALNLKKVVVFGVGMTVPSDEIAEKLSAQNQIPQDRFFYFEVYGGIFYQNTYRILSIQTNY